MTRKNDDKNDDKKMIWKMLRTISCVDMGYLAVDDDVSDDGGDDDGDDAC